MADTVDPNCFKTSGTPSTTPSCSTTRHCLGICFHGCLWSSPERMENDQSSDPHSDPWAGSLYYIVHLYSGRRRSQDFHEIMQSLVNSCTSAWATSTWVVSVDTAHADMNVHSEAVWSWLLTTARSGRILGFLLGPPCETWSGARFEPRRDALGNIVRGPRPLRHSDFCWGLESLSLKELRQLSVGNCLFLRGLWLCIPIALGGGAVLLEHPAPPLQMERPSIFALPLWLFFCEIVGCLGAIPSNNNSVMVHRFTGSETNIPAVR